MHGVVAEHPGLAVDGPASGKVEEVAARVWDLVRPRLAGLEKA